jgi:transcriptional regulator with XRE-family HTH domain
VAVPSPFVVPDDVWDRDEMLAALRDQNIGAVFAAVQKHTGVSQTKIGMQCGLGQPEVSDIMNGKRRIVRVEVIQRIADGLDMPAAARALLGVAPGREQSPAAADAPEAEVFSVGSESDVEIVTRVRGAAITPAAIDALRVSFEAAGRLRHALTNPASVDHLTVAHLRDQVQALDQRYDQVPSTSLLAEAGQCLGQIGFLSANAVRGRVRLDLAAVEAEAATLMGQLVWDASQRRDHSTAHHYLDQAVRAARQLGDAAAEALALLRKSFVALYGERDPRAGLALTTQTAEVASGTSHVLAGLAVLHSAEAYAMLGGARACEQSLARAEAEFDAIDASDVAIDLYSATQLGRLVGSCYLFLNQAKRAQPVLEQTANALTDRSKSRAIVLGNLALASIRQRNLDEAVARLHEAMDVIEVTWGGGGLNVVFGAGRELRQWRGQPIVQDAYDRLLGLMAAV